MDAVPGLLDLTHASCLLHDELFVHVVVEANVYDPQPCELRPWLCWGTVTPVHFDLVVFHIEVQDLWQLCLEKVFSIGTLEG